MCALIRCFSYSHFSISFEHIDFTCQMKELFTHLSNPITTRLFFFSPILSSALCFFAFNEKWKLWMRLISICLLASQTNWKLKLNIPTDSKKIEKKKKNLKFVRIFWRSLQSELFNLFAQFASCPIHKIVIFNRIAHILCTFVPVPNLFTSHKNIALPRIVRTQNYFPNSLKIAVISFIIHVIYFCCCIVNIFYLMH